MLSIHELNTYYGQAHILRGAGLELPAGTALNRRAADSLSAKPLLAAELHLPLWHVRAQNAAP